MMQPQTGIAALPAPAPGQAQGIQQALPQMKPSGGAQGATPPSSAPVLSMMQLPQLNQLLQQQLANPSAAPNPSTLTVLAEISKKQKAAALSKQFADAQAMQAAAQQPRTILEEITAQLPQQPQMQAPPRMATGGPVAFAGGKNVVERLPGETDAEYDARVAQSRVNFGGASPTVFYLPKPSAESARLNQLPLDWASAAADAISEGWDRFTAGSTFAADREKRRSEEDKQRLNEPYRDTGRDQLQLNQPEGYYGNEWLRKPGIAALTPPPAGAPGAAAPAGRTATGRPSAGGPAVLPPDAAAGSPARSADTDAVMKIYEQMGNALASQKNLPPELLQSYAEQSAARKEQYEAAKRAAEETGAAGSEAYNAAMARANVPFLQDTRGILGVLGGLDKRKGKVLGSLAASGEKYLGGVEAAKAAATEKYATTQEKVRAMQALNQQMNVLNKERETALKQSQFDRVNQIDQQILAVQLKAKEFGFARSDTTFAQDVERRKLELQKQGIDVQRAAASKPTAQEFLYGLYEKGKLPGFLEAQQDPKTEGAMVKDMLAALSKQPWMMQSFPPEMQEIIKQELLKLRVSAGATGTPPSNAPLLR